MSKHEASETRRIPRRNEPREHCLPGATFDFEGQKGTTDCSGSLFSGSVQTKAFPSFKRGRGRGRNLPRPLRGLDRGALSLFGKPHREREVVYPYEDAKG